ncbi:hypothetical protein Bbelb_220090 [Branchiostoma belcheri]|nr:hypothetical protein Bbelb_220090 [Branchiostoma belcheri]
MQTAYEKQLRDVQHNTTDCEILTTDCIEPDFKAPLPLSSTYENVEEVVDEAPRSPGVLYQDTTDQNESFPNVGTAVNEAPRSRGVLYQDTADQNESFPLGRTSEEEPKATSDIYGDNEDKQQHVGRSKVARDKNQEERTETLSPLYSVKTESEYESCRPASPSKQYARNRHDEGKETGGSAAKQDGGRQPEGNGDNDDPDSHLSNNDPPDNHPCSRNEPFYCSFRDVTSGNDTERAGLCGFAKIWKKFRRSYFFRILSIVVAIAALFGIGMSAVMLFTTTSETDAEIYPTTAPDRHLKTIIFPPSAGPKMTTVLSDVPTVLSDVPTVLSIQTTRPTERPRKELKLDQTGKRHKLKATKNETAFICEGENKKLSCPAGETLLIDDAMYGRTSSRVCSCPCDSVTCRAEMSLPAVWKNCQGVQDCTVTASDHIFGNPCRGTAKYLWVAYRCFPGCSNPFGMASGDIRDARITASSYYDDYDGYENYGPSHGRLYKGTGEGAWAARNNIIGEWLQVDLGEVENVTGTVIQGRYYGDSWVTSYKLHYGADGTSWTTFTDNDGSEKVFPGNTDANTTVTNLLDYPIDARYVRFVVQSWYKWIGMRVEILGCHCPIGDYIRFRGVCYKSFSEPKTHAGARQECAADGGMLAMPKDDAINAFLHKLPDEVEGRWIGLTVAENSGQWVFEDGQTLTSSGYSNWRPNEPVPDNGHGGCAGFWGSGSSWAEKDCNLARGFICQLKTGGEVRQYTSLGCWGDRRDRAIPWLDGKDSRLYGHYQKRHNPTNKCYQVARSRGYTVFAIQDSGACFGSADAQNTYKKYGPSTGCKADGQGGKWSNEVYHITG